MFITKDRFSIINISNGKIFQSFDNDQHDEIKKVIEAMLELGFYEMEKMWIMDINDPLNPTPSIIYLAHGFPLQRFKC